MRNVATSGAPVSALSIGFSNSIRVSGPNPGTADENVTAVTPGSSRSRAISARSRCRTRPPRSAAVSSLNFMLATTNRSTAIAGPLSSICTTCQETYTAAGRIATATATCATISVVHSEPRRVAVRPFSSCRFADRHLPVALRPGSTPMITAATTARARP